MGRKKETRGVFRRKSPWIKGVNRGQKEVTGCKNEDDPRRSVVNLGENSGMSGGRGTSGKEGKITI